MIIKLLKHGGLVFCLFSILLACSSGTSNHVSTSAHSSSEGTGLAFGEEQVIDFSQVTTMSGSGSWSNVFWLNFEGAKITGDQSFIVDMAGLNEVEIPRFDHTLLGESDIERAEYIADIAKKVSDIYQGFEISFTLEKPNGGHSAIHIGGADFGPRSLALGVAPLDLKNFSGKDIGFIFPHALRPLAGKSNRDLLAIAIAHEIGHSLGIRHNDGYHSLMQPFVDINNHEITSGNLVPGPGTQDSFKVLETNIGLAQNSDTSELPTLMSIGFDEQGDVRQYTVYTDKNVANNQDKNLGLYTYTWKLGELQVIGSNARIPLSERKGDVSITVSNGKNKKTFKFPLSTPIEPSVVQSLMGFFKINEL